MSFLSVPISIFPVLPERKIGEIEVNVVVNENAADQLEITQQPVQQGAMIADHAFKKPTTLSMSIYQRDNLTTSLLKMYQNFIDLQESRTPFDVVTPKRVYRNMLLQTIGQTTDAKTENCLALNLSFQEVIIVKTSTTQVPRSKQKSAGRTGKTENAGKKSALLVLKEGVGKLFSQ